MLLQPLLRSRLTIIFLTTVTLSVTFELSELFHEVTRQEAWYEQLEIDDILFGLLLALPACLGYFTYYKQQLADTQAKLRQAMDEKCALMGKLPLAVAALDRQFSPNASNEKYDELTLAIGADQLKTTLTGLQELMDRTGRDRVEHTSTFELADSVHQIKWQLIDGRAFELPYAYMLMGEDLTDLSRIQEQLEIAQEIIDTTPNGVMVVDTTKQIIYVNRAFEQITGYPLAEVAGLSPEILNSSRHSEDFYHALYRQVAEIGNWQGEIWSRRKNGDNYLEWLTISTLHDESGQPTHYIAQFSEISAHKHMRERLHDLAHYDSLTLLPNRQYFEDQLAERLNTLTDSRLCVAFIGLNKFRRINDSLGNEAGDALLEGFATRLWASIENQDLICRWGGDEFIVAVEFHSGDLRANIADACSGLLRQLDTPFSVAERQINVTASIGVSVYGEDAQSSTQLIHNANIAMAEAKKDGGNTYAIYNALTHQRIVERLEIENRLRRAIETAALEVFYQPQFDCDTQKIYGLEALARWRDEHLGFIPPDKFFAVADQHNLTYDLSCALITNAVESFPQILAVAPDIMLSINFSASQLLDTRISEFLTAETRRLGIPAEKIKVEITEDVLIAEVGKAISIIRMLKSIGFSISLDDFGTGYSSLSYIKDFAIDEIKIDKSFVDDIETSEENQDIVSAVFMMTRSLKVRCVIEGVETAEQLETLKQIGCTKFQGYYFYRPQPLHELLATLQNSVPA